MSKEKHDLSVRFCHFPVFCFYIKKKPIKSRPICTKILSCWKIIFILFTFHFQTWECILSPFYDFLFKLIFGLFLLDRAGWLDTKRQISKMGIDFAFPRKSVFPHMISRGTDFLRILFFAFSMQICSFQCMLSGINLEIFLKFDHWKQAF